MAHRGRGGKSSTLTQEQLQALGCAGKDMPQVQTAPPPTFPPLLSRPIACEVSAALNYQLLWKEHFLNYMNDSPYHVASKSDKVHLNTHPNQYITALENPKIKIKAEFPWHLMPSEISPTFRKRKATSGTTKPTKKAKQSNIQDTLKVLEEKEKTESDGEINEKKASDSEGEEDEEEEVRQDDEMDDENDYGNNYFDNGESYNEEDDNLDDGPIY